MGLKSDRQGSALLFAQLAVGLVGLTILTLAPPASGAVLLLPLPGQTNAAAQLATSRGMLLLGSGPLAGSLVVRTEEPVFTSMLARGFLAMRAGSTSCRTDAGEERA